jgi:hypothetical protein
MEWKSMKEGWWMSTTWQVNVSEEFVRAPAEVVLSFPNLLDHPQHKVQAYMKASVNGRLPFNSVSRIVVQYCCLEPLLLFLY